MADTMTFELVSPERLLATAEVRAVTVPGLDGEFTAMPDHAPFLTVMRPGFVSTQGGEAKRYFVTGGLVEVSNEGVSVLAEEAIEAEELTKDWLETRVEAAAKEAETASEDRRILTAQKLADFRYAALALG